MPGTVILTGATGFVGGHVAIALVDAGYQVRALVRRNHQALWARGLEIIVGGFDADPAPLLAGATAVVHVAGAVRAANPLEFHKVNVDATARLAAAAAERGVKAFVHVSSLAARLPAISPYAASKAAGETAVLAHSGSLQVTVIRPPAVYGPQDRATLPLIRGLGRGLLVHPGHPDARFSLLYGADLAHLVPLLLARPPTSGTVLEPDDGKVGGYSWRDLAATAEARLERRVRMVRVPRMPLAWAAWAAEGYARRAARPPILPRDKIGGALPSRLGERYAHRRDVGRMGAADGVRRRAGRHAGVVPTSGLAVAVRCRTGTDETAWGTSPWRRRIGFWRA